LPSLKPCRLSTTLCEKGELSVAAAHKRLAFHVAHVQDDECASGPLAAPLCTRPPACPCSARVLLVPLETYAKLDITHGFLAPGQTPLSIVVWETATC
jgi:hypothetical protein